MSDSVRVKIALDDIKRPVAKELELFEEKFRQAMKSRVPLLDRITYYIIRRKGKQLRPILVFLSSEYFGGITEQTYRGAALIELMHTATLVHDDVVDDAYYRRGFFSINALWKNKIAVLIGDYLLSKVLLLAVEHSDFEMLRLVSTAVKEMSEGELLQIEKARRLDIDESVYYEIIRQKTASLIAACCAIGAYAGGANNTQIEHFTRFGEYLGMAFQIKDDLFDLDPESNTGKPSGIDIKERKMTLPLIYALSNAGWLEKREITYLVKNKNNDPKAVKKVIDFILNSGGVEYAKQKMNEYHDKALKVLEEVKTEHSDQFLRNLALYVLQRSH
ncbi:polyprenyl synthetase family protein [Thermaurantimonas aggregans]|uniref:polyprenyl synthetase family protein n=1 Tax=Thermaurantimonas aggregans TaxID=2173829 RepID=UPI003531726E